jgi:5,6,7,8-tetrahydromethanopterin hydro-lyase
MYIGESFIGEGAEAAHINPVLGDRAGPVGVAWGTALATPRTGTRRSSPCWFPEFWSSR